MLRRIDEPTKKLAMNARHRATYARAFAYVVRTGKIFMQPEKLNMVCKL